jgi:UDP-N-acetylglucosamine 1-carboxyvinyltransferase
VGATQNLMMLASLAEGTSILKNVAKEPEIEDLASFLNKAGANVQGAGTETIRIEGVPELINVQYPVIPDRIETATYLCAAAITRGDVRLEKVNTEQIQDIIKVLRKVGYTVVEEDQETLHISYDGSALHGVNVKTEPFPGFSTDNQAMLMSVLAMIDGENSSITETIFENRFMHVNELNRMGANIEVDGRKALIHGVRNLSSSAVKMMDLRGGAALLLAGLVADGDTTLYNTHHILRGYEDITGKFAKLGVKFAH